uniref:Uncharacterized protein n=1 Tax=Arundo donax TaxID=35708 RepID=A0A0A9AGY1_ARUDO
MSSHCPANVRLALCHLTNFA